MSGQIARLVPNRNAEFTGLLADVAEKAARRWKEVFRTVVPTTGVTESEWGGCDAGRRAVGAPINAREAGGRPAGPKTNRGVHRHAGPRWPPACVNARRTEESSQLCDVDVIGRYVRVLKDLSAARLDP